jgi:hypothetical protein
LRKAIDKTNLNAVRIIQNLYRDRIEGGLKDPKAVERGIDLDEVGTNYDERIMSEIVDFLKYEYPSPPKN